MSVITLTINVGDLDTVLALYDRIQVWKSSAEFGTYTEITSEDGTPARIAGTVAGVWNLNGLTLTVELDGQDPQNVAFSGTDPFDLQTVLNQINAVFPDLAQETAQDSDMVALESGVVGTRSSLLVSGSAAAVLGLSTTKVNGTERRVRLASPTTSYTFRDFDGLDTEWYKTRFFSSETLAVSEFSDPRQGNPQNILTTDDLSNAQITLADATGAPVVGKRVVFVPVAMQLVDSGGVKIGVLPGTERIEAVTDEQGFASVNLVRSQTFRVIFEGSSYMREFVVPDQASFDLLALIGTSPDPFDIVQVPPRPIKVTT